MSPARSVATDPAVGDQTSTASGTTLRVVGVSPREVTVRDADGVVLPAPEAP
jgi:hypothetical protein